MRIFGKESPGMECELTEEDIEFARGLASLLGGELTRAERLGPEVLLVHLGDGRRLVAKGVARQSWESWRPGRPWAELVALDALGALGAPVPRLVAVDQEHGWLAMEYVPGTGIEEAALRPSPGAFASLTAALQALEEAFAAEWQSLSPWAAASPGQPWELAARLVPLLDADAHGAWAEVAGEALDPSAVRPGPLDVQPDNVVWGERVALIDMASFGYDWTEKRLAAYAQRAGPRPVSLLDRRAYAHYAEAKGEQAAVRLAFFDLLYWGVALTRLLAAMRDPGSKAAGRLRSAWGEPQALVAPFASMWQRERIADPRVERVRNGLRLS